MNKKKSKHTQKPSPLSWIIPLALLIICIANLIQTVPQLNKLITLRKQFPFWFAGDRINDLTQYIKGEKFVGYFTDKDLSLKSANNIAQFQQIQFNLAPTVLELNDLTHKYVIFDCSSPEVAIKKLKEINAQPVKGNHYGLLLVKTR